MIREVAGERNELGAFRALRNHLMSWEMKENE